MIHKENYSFFRIQIRKFDVGIIPTSSRLWLNNSNHSVCVALWSSEVFKGELMELEALRQALLALQSDVKTVKKAADNIGPLIWLDYPGNTI